MTNERQGPKSSDDGSDGWTVTTSFRHLSSAIQDFRSHVDTRFTDADKRYEQRFAAQQEAMKSALAAQQEAVKSALSAAALATDKAEQNLQQWRIASNEWREAMNDRERKFMDKDAAAKDVKQLEDKINDLRASRDRDEGSNKGAGALWGWIFGALGLIAALILAMASLVTVYVSLKGGH
jgi:hypothetical protein